MPDLGRRRVLASLGLGAGALLGGIWLLPRSGLAAGEKVLEEARSAYNHIIVAERGSVRTMYFVVDGTWYIESRLDRSFPASLDLDYTRTMMAGFLLQPAPRSILMVGFGGGQMSNYLFDHFPGIEIDGVDIDPEVIRLARKYFAVPDSPRYRTHVADGRMFVQYGERPRKWDMIILDAFRGVFVPYHLKTVEFYRRCLGRLTNRGVVVANLHDNSSMYPHDRATFAHVFPTLYAFTSESKRQTSLVASADRDWVGPYQLRANAVQAQPAFDFDLRGLASRQYQLPNWQGRGRVLKDDFDPKDLESAADRHNKSCTDNCVYPTR